MHSFFCRELPESGGSAVLDRGESDHLFRTLRGRSGETVRLFDGRGGSAAAVIASGRGITVTQRFQEPEPQLRLHLFCAAPRRNKLDVLLKQAAELGVWSVRFINCERSVADPENAERMTALLLEGCKQSGNPFLPELHTPVSLMSALEKVRGNNWSGYFGDVEPVRNDSYCGGGDVAYFVGPEGGFSGEELKVLRAELAGLNLGPYILRLETAALAGIAVLRRICHD